MSRSSHPSRADSRRRRGCYLMVVVHASSQRSPPPNSTSCDVPSNQHDWCCFADAKFHQRSTARMRISSRFAPHRFSVRRGPDRTVGGICPASGGLSLGLCGRPFRNERPSRSSGGMQAPRHTSGLRLFSGYASMVEARSQLGGIFAEHPSERR